MTSHFLPSVACVGQVQECGAVQTLAGAPRNTLIRCFLAGCGAGKRTVQALAGTHITLRTGKGRVSNLWCVKTHADGTKLQKCENCLKIRYCSVSCQKKDRARHRPECRDIVKAKKLKRSRRLAESSMQVETKSASSSPTTIAINQEDERADSSSLSSSTTSSSYEIHLKKVPPWTYE